MSIMMQIALWLLGTAGVIVLSLKFGGYKGWTTVVIWLLWAVLFFVVIWLVPTIVSQRVSVLLSWIVLVLTAVERYVLDRR